MLYELAYTKDQFKQYQPNLIWTSVIANKFYSLCAVIKSSNVLPTNFIGISPNSEWREASISDQCCFVLGEVTVSSGQLNLIITFKVIAIL